MMITILILIAFISIESKRYVLIPKYYKAAAVSCGQFDQECILKQTNLAQIGNDLVLINGSYHPYFKEAAWECVRETRNGFYVFMQITEFLYCLDNSTNYIIDELVKVCFDSTRPKVVGKEKILGVAKPADKFCANRCVAKSLNVLTDDNLINDTFVELVQRNISGFSKVVDECYSKNMQGDDCVRGFRRYECVEYFLTEL